MNLKNKSREELFRIWKQRIRFAKIVHDEKVRNWAERVFDEFSGDANSNLDTGERYVQFAQTVQAVEQTIQPHLLFKNPKFQAIAKKPEWEKREALVAAVVNQEYSDIKKTGHRIELENELALLDARLLPFGVTKTSWRVEGGLVEEKPEGALEGALERLGGFLGGALEGAKGFLTGQKPKSKFSPVIENEIGHITERVNPLNVLLDYSAPHITKQKFVIEIMHGPKESLQTPRYDQNLIENLKDDTSLIPSYKIRSGDKDEFLNSPDHKGLTWYEIHDLENRIVHTIVDGVNDFIEFNSPYQVDEGSLYSFLWFIDLPNQVYPAPPIKFYRKTAKEFSYIYSQLSEQIDKFLPKIGFDVNRLDKVEQDKWRAGRIGTLVGFNGSPQGAWDVLQPRVQDDLFKYLALQKELMNLEAGINDYEVAVPEERKATEAKIIAQGTRARRFAPQKRVKSFLVNQSHTVWQVLAENASQENFVKVLGQDDTLEWWADPQTGKQSWTRENISGDYFFDFDVESISPVSEAERRQQNQVNMETVLRPELKQGLLQEGIELLLAPFFEKFASENMGLKDKNKYYRKLNGLEPGDEHTLWMTGQYPEISERELKDPKFLVKHFQAHEMFINSPGFQTLHPQLQQGAIQHRDSYLPHLARIMKSQGGQGDGRSQETGNQRELPRELPAPEAPSEQGSPVEGGVGGGVVA